MDSNPLLTDALGLGAADVVKEILDNDSSRAAELLRKHVERLETAKGGLHYAPLEWRNVLGPPIVALIRKYPGESLAKAIEGWCGLALQCQEDEIYLKYITSTYTYKSITYRVKLERLTHSKRYLVLLDLFNFSKEINRLDINGEKYLYRSFKPLIGPETYYTGSYLNGVVELKPNNYDPKTWKRSKSPRWIELEHIMFNKFVLRHVHDTNFMVEESKENDRFIRDALGNLEQSLVAILEAFEECPTVLKVPPSDPGNFETLYYWQLNGKVPANMLFYSAINQCLPKEYAVEKLSKLGQQYLQVLDDEERIDVDTNRLRKSWATLPAGTQRLFEELLERPISEHKTFQLDMSGLQPHEEKAGIFAAVFFLSPYIRKYTARINQLNLGGLEDILAACLRLETEPAKGVLPYIIQQLYIEPSTSLKQVLMAFDKYVKRISHATFIPRPYLYCSYFMRSINSDVLQAVIVQNPDETLGLLYAGEFFDPKFKNKFVSVYNVKDSTKFVFGFYTNFRGYYDPNCKFDFNYDPKEQTFDKIYDFPQ